MKFKKVLILLLTIVMAVTMAVAFSACNFGGSSSSTSNASASADGSTSANGSASNGSSEGSSNASSAASSGSVSGGSAEGSSSASTSVADIIGVSSVELSDSFAKYDANRAEKTAANKRSEFFDKEESYLVGDDNAFSFMPDIEFLNISTAEPAYPASWTYKATFYRLDSLNFVKLEGADITTYIDSFNTTSCLVDFSTEAVGETFKVEILPDGLSANQQANPTNLTMTMTVSVVDGYNVTNAKEMAYFNNSNDYKNYSEDTLNVWDSFKQENGLALNYYPNALILHNDVQITKDDVPSYFFYQDSTPATGSGEDYRAIVYSGDSDYARTIGSLRDQKSIYFRRMGEGENFDLFGNYFSIDTTVFPLITRTDDLITDENKIISHTDLFKIQTINDDPTINCTASIKNINFIGNAQRAEEPAYAGGLILAKVQDVVFTACNNLASSWYITYFANLTRADQVLIEKCKGYDSFNVLLYVYGADNVVIKDSEFIGAGGPAMIVDHIEPQNGANSLPSSVNVYNSEIHSFVTGNEGWFSIYEGASTLPGAIKPSSAAFNPGGKTFVLPRKEDKNVTYFDLIALYKSGNASAVTSDTITGYLNFDDSSYPLDFGNFKKPWDGVGNTTALSQTIQAFSGAPIFTTSAGGLAILNPQVGLLSPLDPTTPITDVNNEIFKGDYLNLYYGTMGICFGYYDAGTSYPIG